MKRFFKVLLLFVVTIVFALSAGQVMAKKKQKDAPPGWEKGEKRGWKDGRPPGQDRRDMSDDNEDDDKDKKKKRKKKKDKKKKKSRKDRRDRPDDNDDNDDEDENDDD